MKLLILTLLFGFIYCGEDDVLIFTDSNFDDEVKKHSVILIEFYAPWCGHCKALKPKYEAAASRLKANDPPISIAKVDCTVETKVCQRFSVSGYPTLKVFKAGEFAFEYGGEREEDGIVSYMISKSGPSLREISSKEAAEKFTSQISPVIFGFVKELDSTIHKELEGVANALSDDFRFAFTTNADIMKEFGFEDKIVLMYPKKMHNKFEPKHLLFDGKVAKDDIKSWVESNAMGLCGLRTSATDKYFQNKPQVFIYYDANFELNPKQANYWRNRVLKVAKKFIDSGKKMTVGVVNIKEVGHELNEFGHSAPDNEKVYVIARNLQDKKFRMEEDFSMPSFEKFLNDFFDNKLQSYLKSEEIPESNAEPVKVVVAKQFDEIVNDPSKDVLIEFYAPWCGHCKTLAPKYEEVATTLKNEKNIAIVKMDATANDVPSPYQVSGFPTIYYAPKNGKGSPKLYNGGREAADFVKYLAAESTDPLSGFDRSGNPKKSEL